ncbi:MAG TPA: methyltransferase domain-containing protein [Pyrinomonadaceae bacterium]|jgi:SAM-dependent methyltransferase|nr:methyltransferase domain-containing protein [Pyrinomonadaceae bacterium]
MEQANGRACRLCGAGLEGGPELELRRVPRGAQYFPKPDERRSDFGVDLDIYQCHFCGLVQLSGEPIIYGEGETSATAFSPGMSEHRTQQMRDFVGRFGLAGKKVIDVGCGDGHVVEILAGAGADAFGLEPSNKARALAEGRGLRILGGYSTRGRQFEGGPYDAFTSIHSLEHAPDPNDYLQGVRGSLAPGAAGLVEVPSVEQAVEHSRFYDFLADHLSYFSAATLRLALEKNGFEVLEVERDWNGEHLVARVRRREGVDFAELRGHVEVLPREFERFVARYEAEGQRLALWGASHHAITLLAMVETRGIEYVVDSAAYKQGRLTPVSHLPIVAPDQLRSHPVDAVLVFAPRYNDEIVAQLRDELEFKGTVALLRGSRIEVLQ